MIVQMFLAQALEYPTGQYVRALENASGRRRGAIRLANWDGNALAIRSAISLLPPEHEVFMLNLPVSWKERSSTRHLPSATASAKATVRVTRLYCLKYRLDSKRWDLLGAAIEDAEAAIKVLIGAAKTR